MLPAFNMKKLKFFKILMFKAWFDKGLNITNYFKYLIAFYGLASLNVKNTLIIGIVYCLFCLILGFLWYYYKIIETENEIGNIFNPFQREMREKLKKRFNSKNNKNKGNNC